MAECESSEHPDCIQRNESIRDTTEGNHQPDGRQTEKDYAVAKDEPISAVRQLTRQVSVTGHNRSQAREVGITSVGGNQQNAERSELSCKEKEVTPPVDVLGKLGDDCLSDKAFFVANRFEVLGQDAETQKQRAKNATQQDQRCRGIL